MIPRNSNGTPAAQPAPRPYTADEHRIEAAKVSRQLVAVYQTLTRATGWLTNHEIARETGVSLRTVQKHTTSLTFVGAAESEVVLGYEPRFRRYRLRQDPSDGGRAYLDRIEEAANTANIYATVKALGLRRGEYLIRSRTLWLPLPSTK